MADKTKYQKSETELIHRSELINAPYNPRTIGKDEQKRLKKMLEEHGLVNNPTWNKRTGHIVGGHQRIAVLDILEEKKDYMLEVSVVDVDEKEEKELNVVLNNPSIQGEYDIDLLGDLFVDNKLEFEELGFTSLDIDFMFNGDERFSELYDPPEVDTEKNKLQEIKDVRKESEEKFKDKNSINYYATIVFESEELKREFFKKIGVPVYEKYITEEQIKRYK